ncbi:MAG: DUF1549 domain-containing protein [Planctomycetaceae bacterium]
MMARLRWFLICSLGLSAGPLPGQDALHNRVDQLIDAVAVSPPAPSCSDAEFLRRVMLDLVGAIPSSAETRGFLDDPAPNKREVLVDRLLADPRHPLHMAAVFNVMWMERRPDKYVPAADWLKFLQTAFQQNKPYDQLVREILTADSNKPETRPAAKFLLDREADPHLLTRDIGRMFFGVDMQCAQCHDHPLIDDYLQTDYYGLYAFMSRVSLFLDVKDNNKGYLAEKADGIVEFKSVFTGNAGKTRPRLLGGLELEEPRFPIGDDYVVPPTKDPKSVPKFSRRELLAQALADGTNPAFRRNIANRLWAHLMGRGLVHPVDLHHSANPPSHPEVLELLANEIAVMKFDLRKMLRELALTKAYQRAIDVPAEIPPAANAQATLAAWKNAEEKSLAEAEAAKAEYSKLLEQLSEANKTIVPLEEAFGKAEAAAVALKKPLDDATAALTAAQQQEEAKKSALGLVNEALAKGTEAAKVLTNDAEVTQAVAVFQARVQKLTGELEAATKAVAEKTPPVQEAAAKLKEANAAVDVAFAPLIEARRPIDALKAQIVTVQNRLRTQLTLAQNLKKRETTLMTLSGLPNHKSAIAVAETAIAGAQAEQVAANQSVESQTAAVNQLAVAMSEVEKVRAAARQQVETAKATQAAKETVVKTVAEAVAKTEQALAALSDDADLKTALEKLKSKQDPLAKELAALGEATAVRVSEEQTAAAAVKSAFDTVTAAQNELSNRQQALVAKEAAIAQAVEQKNAEIAAVNDAVTQLTAGWTADFSIRDLKPLTPEQLGWSILQATGVTDNYRIAADGEIEKTVPKASVENDPVQKANRAAQVELQVREKLLVAVAPFVTFYGSAPGQPQDDFFATADQALFLANAGNVRSWIAPGNPLFNRLNDQPDPKLLADELYLSVLSRRPTDAEAAAVANFLAAKANERPAVIQELIWGLIASAEFRFQQ